LYYFQGAFTIKKLDSKKVNTNKWIKQGIKVSRQRMKYLSNLKRNLYLSKENLKYIGRYHTIYKRVILEAKRTENDRYIASAKCTTMKATWQLINKETGNSHKSDQNIILKQDGKIITDPQETTEIFNTYFIQNVEALLAQNNVPPYGYTFQTKIKQNPNTVFLLPINEEETMITVCAMKGKPLAAFDKVPENLIKKCIQYIKEPLAHIFKASLVSGVFPDKMKLATVRPIHKRGDTQESGNYRPISILPALSKILEKLVYKRLMYFIKQYNILTDIQHGFRENKSTQSASQSFIEYIQEAMDKIFYIVGIFLDLTRAYDVLNHDILVNKLNCYAVRGTTNQWFKSYLLHHTQFVELLHTVKLSKDFLWTNQSTKEVKKKAIK
jgi:hypothetical protein